MHERPIFRILQLQIESDFLVSFILVLVPNKVVLLGLYRVSKFMCGDILYHVSLFTSGDQGTSILSLSIPKHHPLHKP